MLVVKNSPVNTGDSRDTGSIPGLERSLTWAYHCLSNSSQNSEHLVFIFFYMYVCQKQTNVKSGKDIYHSVRSDDLWTVGLEIALFCLECFLNFLILIVNKYFYLIKLINKSINIVSDILWFNNFTQRLSKILRCKLNKQNTTSVWSNSYCWWCTNII